MKQCNQHSQGPRQTPVIVFPIFTLKNQTPGARGRGQKTW